MADFLKKKHRVVYCSKPQKRFNRGKTSINCLEENWISEFRTSFCDKNFAKSTVTNKFRFYCITIFSRIPISISNIPINSKKFGVNDPPNIPLPTVLTTSASPSPYTSILTYILTICQFCHRLVILKVTYSMSPRSVVDAAWVSPCFASWPSSYVGQQRES